MRAHEATRGIVHLCILSIYKSTLVLTQFRHYTCISSSERIKPYNDTMRKASRLNPSERIKGYNPGIHITIQPHTYSALNTVTPSKYVTEIFDFYTGQAYMKNGGSSKSRSVHDTLPLCGRSTGLCIPHPYMFFHV